MDNQNKKLEKLKETIVSHGSVLIAFSGGVDSTFLLRVCVDALKESRGRVLAVTAKSSTYPASELLEATRLAISIGAEHMIIDSEELDIKGFADNPPDRCYYCKNELFTKLLEIASDEGIAIVSDGANADDRLDYRPGSKAASELGVHSLLAETSFTKEEIRAVSKELGLSTWEKPALACLASRFPYGTAITHEKLAMVEKAESAIKLLGFGQARVRHHGEVARLELDRDEMNAAIEPLMADKIYSALKEAGFIYVALDIQGYRTGSMNETLTDNLLSQ